MGLPILIIGKSGSGKSASMRNCKPTDIGIINVLGKPLPFKSEFQYIVTDDYARIKKLLLQAKTNSLVIDDAGYLITNEYMNGQGQKKGNAVFEFYAQLATNFWSLLEFIQHELPEETIVYLLMHEDQNEFGDVKPKTIGKMLDEKVCIEGLFTIVLRSMKLERKYVFKTQSNGLDVSKSPIGLFDSDEVDNDLLMVDKTIREYYNLTKITKSKENPKEEKENETNK